MARRRTVWFIVSFFVAYFSVAGIAAAITLPELASRVENMSRTEREALLIRGAKEEKEVMPGKPLPISTNVTPKIRASAIP